MKLEQKGSFTGTTLAIEDQDSSGQWTCEVILQISHIMASAIKHFFIVSRGTGRVGIRNIRKLVIGGVEFKPITERYFLYMRLSIHIFIRDRKLEPDSSF